MQRHAETLIPASTPWCFLTNQRHHTWNRDHTFWLLKLLQETNRCYCNNLKQAFTGGEEIRLDRFSVVLTHSC